eukprot:662990-Hanusia_phi.AAC.3
MFWLPHPGPDFIESTVRLIILFTDRISYRAILKYRKLLPSDHPGRQGPLHAALNPIRPSDSDRGRCSPGARRHGAGTARTRPAAIITA